MEKAWEAVRHNTIRPVRLSDEAGHYFYGYYDNPAFSGDDRYHLCHRVSFCDRLPGPEDRAELGLFDLRDGSFRTFAETTAWNFQQGSMLQWHPLAPGKEAIFNIHTPDGFRGVVHDVGAGARRELDRPVANVDPTGRYALSVSFSRMFDFRPGYGYAGIPDPYAAEGHPQDDGIFLIDLATGRSELIVSLHQLWQFTGASFGFEERKLLINHITFNTDGSRFLCLVRYFPLKPGGTWGTAIVTANRDGSGLFLLSDYAYASHYHWRDTEHVVFHSRGAEGSDEGNQLYVLKDLTHEVRSIDPSFFLEDGHCSYSPDRTTMLYDSYPDEEHYRHLYVYDLVKRRGKRLASYYSPPALSGDLRCDLHPRWSRSGRMISFDSAHEGRRHLYVVDLSETLQHR